MSRGDRREDIFLDDVDRQDFLKTLAEACQKTGWQIHAYCLMNNYFHLEVIEKELKRLGWKEDELSRRAKSDPGKLALAARLRKETTLTLKWIAARLQLGTSKSANATLHRWMHSASRL